MCESSQSNGRHYIGSAMLHRLYEALIDQFWSWDEYHYLSPEERAEDPDYSQLFTDIWSLEILLDIPEADRFRNFGKSAEAMLRQ